MGALTLPPVAAIGAWIAYHQMKTARDKLRLDLYDRRMVVYQATTFALARVLEDRPLTRQDYDTFKKDALSAQWLFDHEVRRYLEVKFGAKLYELVIADAMLETLRPGKQHSELENRRQDLLTWFSGERIDVDEIFSPYFGFTHRASSGSGLLK